MTNYFDELLIVKEQINTFYKLSGKLNLYISYCLSKDCEDFNRTLLEIEEIRGLLLAIEKKILYLELHSKR